MIESESREQMHGRLLSDFVPENYHQELTEQVARIENGDISALGLAVDLQTGTGRSSRAILVSTLVEWDGSEHVQTAVLPIDETDSSSHRRLREMAMDEAPIGITISDPSVSDNPLIYVNDGFSELTGYPRDEILGQNCRFLQGKATRAEPVDRMRQAIAAEEPVTVDLRNYRKDGSMFWNRVTIVPIPSDSETVTNYLGYQQDVTAEKRFEQDLSLFKEQAEGSKRAIFVTQPDGTIEYVNPAFTELTGYSGDEAIGQNPRILKSGAQDDEFYSELWEQISSGEVWQAKLTNKTKEGERYEVEQKIIPATDATGNITRFVAIEEDVTERVVKTQTLAVLNRILRHNLRNSLTAIDGHAELLESTDMDPEARKASIRAIRNQAESMTSIAEKIAEIQAIWGGSDEPATWDRLDVGALVETYRVEYPEAEISVVLDGEATIDIRNASLFEKAMDEAMENAIVHADQTPVEVTVTMDREQNRNSIQVSIADNGPGIPEIERHVIDSGKETPLSHSLGVGLWVMKWVATTLGGELTIEDNEPRGSVVKFALPIEDFSPSSSTDV